MIIFSPLEVWSPFRCGKTAGLPFSAGLIEKYHALSCYRCFRFIDFHVCEHLPSLQFRFHKMAWLNEQPWRICSRTKILNAPFISQPWLTCAIRLKVRISMQTSNLKGHLKIPKGCRPRKLQHLLYAPSISVYDLNGKTPFSTDNSVNYLVSLCTAPQKNE